ncbi:MAG: hypothetical protein ACLQG3_05905 [Terracidiphilus sp.]
MTVFDRDFAIDLLNQKELTLKIYPLGVLEKILLFIFLTTPALAPDLERFQSQCAVARAVQGVSTFHPSEQKSFAGDPGQERDPSPEWLLDTATLEPP